MNIALHHYANDIWKDSYPHEQRIAPLKCQLVLAFGAAEVVTQPDIFARMKTLYPNAQIVLSSTSGEISEDQVFDQTVVATAIEFQKTDIRCAASAVDDGNDSFTIGAQLMEKLNADNLCYILIISDGTKINGSDLVTGFNSKNFKQIPLSGGLAGDGDRFVRTYTGLNAPPSEGNVIAIGFYGAHLIVGHGSMGGWDEFGPERTITRAEQNVLYEIDGKSALDLYKEYLGEYVQELPGSALLFPLSLKRRDEQTTLVRTILAINEKNASMTFAGNMPEGSTVRLMKANFDRLIEGSANAATSSLKEQGDKKPDLALLISCVGRKLILQHRVEEEVESAREIFGDGVVMTGFYSYGEISPLNTSPTCELHNQTMTITTFTEI